MTIQVTKDESYSGFEGSSDWLDEADLQKKYEGKPDQLKAIMDNARTMEHPARRVTLCEDVSFKSTNGTKASEVTTTKRTAVQEAQLRAEKKPKAEPKPKPEAEKKTLDDSQREKLNKISVSVDKLLDQMTKSRSDAADEKVKEYVPAKVPI